ncbi:MAG: YabN family protein [Acutalibacteraceae bacterium]
MKDVSKFAGKTRYSIDDLLEILAILRSPEGCPWDREQDHKSIRRDFLEECYEAIEAIDTDNTALLQEELGDVLLQVVFHSEIERELGHFDFADVVSGIAEKMVVRHPHVFSDVQADTTDAVLKNWDQIKRETKRQKSNREVLESVSPAMPALMRAQKVRKKAANGRPCRSRALKAQIAAAVMQVQAEDGAEQLGRALFDLTALAQQLGVDAERALFDACRAYIANFEAEE